MAALRGDTSIRYTSRAVLPSFTPATENVEIDDVRKKYDLMAAINSLNRLICYNEWRKYQACRVASSFNYLIEQKQKMLILLEFVTIFFFILTIKLNS